MKYSIKARDTYSAVFDRVAAAEYDRKKTEYFKGNNEDQNIKRNELIPSVSTELSATANSCDFNTRQSQPQQLIPKKPSSIPRPTWHAPWKLSRVISGHLGWVRCVAVEPGNEWYELLN